MVVGITEAGLGDGVAGGGEGPPFSVKDAEIVGWLLVVLSTAKMFP